MRMESAMAAKRAVNVSIDAELVAEAKAFGTNISAVLDAALRAAHREKRAALWREENGEAVTAWNDYVQANGLWADKYRP
jgi:antitoxin CcdA